MPADSCDLCCSPVPGNPNQQVSNVSDQTLVSVQRDLMCLKTFIEQ